MHPDFGLCHIKTVFRHATKDMLIWSKRLPKLRTQIAHSNADIICLQEVSNEGFVDDFGSYFQQKHGYDYRVNATSNRAEEGKGEGDFTTAIMYKSSKFECVHEDYRSRATILLLTNKLEQSQCSRCTKSRRICLFHSIFVVNVHLESPRKGKKNDSQRVNALKSIMKRIRFCISEKLKLNIDTETANIRILITGDFNSGVENPPSMMLMNRNPECKAHPYRFQEAYHEKLVSDKLIVEEEFDANLRIKEYPTMITTDFVYSIDLMFYTADNMVLNAVGNTMSVDIESDIKWKEKCAERIERWKKMIKYLECSENGQQTKMQLANFSKLWAMPNDQVPSDHLPICAIFEMKNLCEDRKEGENEECRCCLEPTVKKKLSKKEKREMRRKKKERDLGYWKFHEIKSF